MAMELTVLDIAFKIPMWQLDGLILEPAVGTVASCFPSSCIVAAPLAGQFCGIVPGSYSQRHTLEPIQQVSKHFIPFATNG